jgi:hypothetical protein
MIRKIAAATAAWFVSCNVYALDGVALEVGRGEDRTNIIRIALLDRWGRLPGYWEFSGAVWDNRFESTADVGITPVFRFERAAYYFEAAIGVHLVQTRISASRTFSTSLQFGDHIGAGVRSGRFDFGLRLQHISNAGLDHPNPGINFLLARLQYSLD